MTAHSGANLNKKKRLFLGSLLVFSTALSSGCRRFSKDDQLNSSSTRNTKSLQQQGQNILKVEIETFVTLTQNRNNSLGNQIYLIEDLIASMHRMNWSHPLSLNGLKKQMDQLSEDQGQLLTDLNKSFSHLQSSLRFLHQDLNSLLLPWSRHCSNQAGFLQKLNLQTQREAPDLFKRPFKKNLFTAMLWSRKAEIHKQNPKATDLTTLSTTYQKNCHQWLKTLKNKMNKKVKSQLHVLDDQLSFEQLKTKAINLLSQLQKNSRIAPLKNEIQKAEEIYYFWIKPLLEKAQALMTHLSRHEYNHYYEDLVFSKSQIQAEVQEMNQSLSLTLRHLFSQIHSPCSGLETKDFSTVHSLSAAEQKYLQDRQWHIWQTLKPFCTEASLWKK